MMQFEIPKERPSIIKVIGVGGGGSNAVNHMYKLGIKGVEFVVCNTDHQALDNSPVPKKIQLGPSLTEGRGAGAIPEVGKNAAIENLDELREILRENTKMVFITAGMGGGTGTGAAPILAGVAKELGILTVGIVTVPFSFEGRKRKELAEKGIEELRNNVDTLLVICNDKLRLMHGNLKLSEAFAHADNILSVAAKSIAEIITTNLHLNVDFADVQTVMKESGVAIMGASQAEGEDRALSAVTAALDSPLLNDNQIEGARYILLNITSGNLEATMDEIGEINDFVQEQAGNSADIIMGIGTDESLGDKISVTIIATGFNTNDNLNGVIEKKVEKVVFDINGGSISSNIDAESSPVVEPEVTASETEFVDEEINEKVEASGIKLITKDEESVNLLPQATVNTFDPVEDEEITMPLQTENNETVVHNLYDEVDVTEDELTDDQSNSGTISELSSETVSDITVDKEEEEIVFEFDVNNDVVNEETPVKSEPVYESLPPVERNTDAEENENHGDEIFGESQLQKTRERIQKLRELSYKVRSTAELNELEKEPAYKRRNIELKDVPSSTGEEVSRYTLSNDNESKPEIKPNNPFLHDRVD